MDNPSEDHIEQLRVYNEFKEFEQFLDNFADKIEVFDPLDRDVPNSNDN